MTPYPVHFINPNAERLTKEALIELVHRAKKLVLAGYMVLMIVIDPEQPDTVQIPPIWNPRGENETWVFKLPDGRTFNFYIEKAPTGFTPKIGFDPEIFALLPKDILKRKTNNGRGFGGDTPSTIPNRGLKGKGFLRPDGIGTMRDFLEGRI